MACKSEIYGVKRGNLEVGQNKLLHNNRYCMQSAVLLSNIVAQLTAYFLKKLQITFCFQVWENFQV